MPRLFKRLRRKEVIKEVSQESGSRDQQARESPDPIESARADEIAESLLAALSLDEAASNLLSQAGGSIVINDDGAVNDEEGSITSSKLEAIIAAEASSVLSGVSGMSDNDSFTYYKQKKPSFVSSEGALSNSIDRHGGSAHEATVDRRSPCTMRKISSRTAETFSYSSYSEL